MNIQQENERNRWVVVAEDEPDTARLVEHHLKRNGWQVKLAMDGVAALDAVVEHKPDLVIMDLMMPRMDGLELCRLLKTSPRTQHIPVIMLTALEVENRREGYRIGADEYITKPFSLRELIDRANYLIEVREAELASTLDFP